MSAPSSRATSSASSPGTDAALKDTYVAFGAHYDHVGYSQLPPSAGRGFGGNAPGGCVGQTRTRRDRDVISNGADDDGSGTVALMGLAKAFALGPKPKRSLLFVWHSGEEAGLYGSRYNADYPVVPNEKIVAQLNIDMIGRNRCDDPKEENTVYIVGSDRISTELHNLNEEANASLAKPLNLDYELNDPADPESIYTRSDHYSYAPKGIPIIFFTTGLHKDYHYVTDEVVEDRFPETGAHHPAGLRDRPRGSRTSITCQRATTRGRGWGRVRRGRSNSVRVKGTVPGTEGRGARK